MSKKYTLIFHKSGGFNESASTISEHINAFVKYIDTPVILMDTTFIFSDKYFKEIEKHNVTNIILHYSLFGYTPFGIPSELAKYLSTSKAKKIAFFQDENQSCNERYEAINNFNISIVFTILEKKYHKEVYLDNTTCKSVHRTLTGYVDEELITTSEQYKKKYEERSCDVGYRARPLPIYLGLGAQEKTEIADKFIQYAKDDNLTMDIQTSEESRLYGEDWFEFLGNSRCMLGVESGTSIFDTDGSIKDQMNSFINEHPNASDEELHKQILNDHEDKIYYRAISPRIFESAIFRNLMILYEGKYQSVIEPGKHYLELKKDFSNIDEILKKIRDPKIYEEITDRAYKDLILSGDYSYRGFIEDFCKKVGIKSVERGVINKNKILYFPAKRRKIALRVYSMIRSKFNFNFYGRDYLRKKVHKIMGIQKDRFLFK